MVLERLSKTAGAGAGGFAGGFFSSPTFIILGAITVLLLFFQGDIRKAFGSFGENFGKVELPDITLPTINFPTFEFPEISFPEISFPEIKLPDFSFLADIFGGSEDLPSIPEPFVEPERMDVPFGDTGEIIDIVPDVTGGRADRLAGVIDQPDLSSIIERDIQDDIVGLTPAQAFGFIERGVIPTGFMVENGVLVPEVMQQTQVLTSPQQQTLGAPRDEIPFAVANVEETQAEFQERSQLFAETFPNIAFSTSLTDEITFGRQLSRNQEDFQSILDAEARRSESIFAALFGNVQNPDF